MVSPQDTYEAGPNGNEVLGPNPGTNILTTNHNIIYIYTYIHIYLSDSESTQDPKPYKTQPTQQTRWFQISHILSGFESRFHLATSCNFPTSIPWGTISMLKSVDESVVSDRYLRGTNISPEQAILKMIFLFQRWDMLVPWRVSFIFPPWGDDPI